MEQNGNNVPLTNNSMALTTNTAMKNMQKGVGNDNSLVALTAPAKANKRWSHFEDEALVNCLIKEIQEGGKRCDNGWMPGALAHVALKLRDILKNPSLESAHVINRLRSIKDKYIAIKEASSQSGFFITPDGKTLADDLAWEAFVQANPKARSLRFSSLRNFDKLCIIFGVDHANGNLSYEANDAVHIASLNLSYEANDAVHIASLNLNSATPGDTSDPSEFMNVDSDNPNPGAPNEDASRQGQGAFRADGQPSGAKSKSQAGQKRRRSIPGGL